MEDLPGLDEARLSPDTSVRELGMAPGEWDDLVARMMEALGVRPAPSELRNAARLRDVAVLFSEHLTA
ncbi:MAG: hypothetical protein J0L75_15730 [Spirochaetes bacterium]|nr:hypothetical protein [Spirochaetota bacterium]